MNTGKWARRLIIAIGVVSSTAYAGGMGPLDDVIQPRNDDTWSVAALRNGGWRFDNAATRYAITYYYLYPAGDESGRREVSVNVDVVAGEPDSLVGILYGFEEAPRSYFMFTLGGDRSVNLHYFDNGSMDEKMKLGIGDLADGPVRLTVREYGNEIALLVNGQEKSRIGNDRIGRGAVGVVAAHVGQFQLNDFSIDVR
ncbi:MAG: hypothetical protein AAGC71_18050 [Pseudomonadota bacterium]